MKNYYTKADYLNAGKVACHFCRHFVPGTTPNGLGFCALTQNRVSTAEGGRPPTPDRQGLPPDTNPNLGCAACFPYAPRVCEKYQE